MDLKEIRKIINSDYADVVMEAEIIRTIAEDEHVIPSILKILHVERANSFKLTSEMNQLLSKADIGLDNPAYNKNNFMQKEIEKFYEKYKKYVGHCFKSKKKGK